MIQVRMESLRSALRLWYNNEEEDLQSNTLKLIKHSGNPDDIWAI